MKSLQSSYTPRVGDTLKLSCNEDLDQASTVYPPKNQKYQTCPPLIKKILKVSNPPPPTKKKKKKKKSILYLDLKKKAIECLEIAPQNSPLLRWPSKDINNSSYPNPNPKYSSF